MLELTFVTSSNAKLNHAIHLCRRYSVKVVGYRHKYYGKGYIEPRIRDREALLERSIEDAYSRWKKNISSPDEKFFFIEDTSVIINALSEDGCEVPGVDIKYWMRENTFSDVDAILKKHGNDRRVTVRSDVFLVLKKSLRDKVGKKYVRFSSETNGVIAEREFDISTNPIYPWLDNKTFNKWFVPDGASVPISMLNISEADKYDFRADAFNEMLAFLEQNKLINRVSVELVDSTMVQGDLLGQSLFVVIGQTCSGKTTLAEYMVDRYGYYHIEASDFMYLNYYKKLGVGSDVSITDFAKNALIDTPLVVVDEILTYIEKAKEWPLFITGLRTVNEIRSFNDRYSGKYKIEVVLVDANDEIRLRRYLRRNRGGKATKEKFIKETKLQSEMGLSLLLADYSDTAVVNESTFEEFYWRFAIKYCSGLVENSCFRNRHDSDYIPKALEDAILVSLYVNQCNFMTTTEISKVINATFSNVNIEKNKNNVSRYFNQANYPYYEVVCDTGVNKYRLSQTGQMHARWMLCSNRKSRIVRRHGENTGTGLI